MQALSQLSYGPETLQCSRELVVSRPVDEELLVVPGRRQPELNLGPSREPLGREVVAPVDIGTVRSDGIDLVWRVHAFYETGCRSSRRVAANGNHVAVAVRP